MLLSETTKLIKREVKKTKPNKRKLILCLIAAVVVICVALALGLGLSDSDDSSTYSEQSRLGVFQKAAVAANGAECAAIGRHILEKGGSAADSAIATLLCEGITCPQSMGIGGGFLLTIYTKKTGLVETLNAREIAPGAAFKDMFENKTSQAKTGGLSVAVPGELRGYWALHQRYGILPWKELFQPAIDLCRRGHLVTPYLAGVLKKREDKIKAEPSLREIFIDPNTGEVYKQGDRIKRPRLGATLRTISKEGSGALYNGSLTQNFLNDIAEAGGILTEKDMANYKVRWEPPIMATLPDGMVLHTISLPGSGVLLAYILRVLKGLLPGTQIENTHNETIVWQRIIETYKHAYGARSNLGDMYFVPGMKEYIEKLSSTEQANETRYKISDTETHNNWTYYGGNFSQPEDHGTAHVSVLAPNGDAVAVTSTINYILGAMFRSPSTGIILNDEMDDFSIPNADNIYGVPPSPANYIEPGKRPLSSMCPTIITDSLGDVRLVIGAAGGTKITTSVAFATIRHLWFNDTLVNAVDAKRMHHQLFPMTIEHEIGFDKEILQGLQKIGHNTTEIPPDDGFAALTAVSKYKDEIHAAFDKRRSGSVAGF